MNNESMATKDKNLISNLSFHMQISFECSSGAFLLEEDSEEILSLCLISCISNKYGTNYIYRPRR